MIAISLVLAFIEGDQSGSLFFLFCRFYMVDHSTLINFLAYRVFTHPFFIQLRIWNCNWVSSILLRTPFSINWVKWKKQFGKNDVRGVLSLFSSTFAFA